MTRELIVLRKSSRLAERIKEDALRFVEGAKSENTKRAYRHAWKDWEEFCELIAHAPALPGQPETVAAYLALLSQEKTVSTIDVRLAAISWRHALERVADPTRDTRVLEVMKGIRRQLGVRPKGRRALSVEDLAKIVETLPRTLTGARDRAILLIGFSGAFRRSEIVGLTVEDLTFSKEGVLILLRKSKTDQEGAGVTKLIPRIGGPLCAVSALKFWLLKAKISTGPIFVKVFHSGALGSKALTGQVVEWIVKEGVARIGLDPSEYGAHSLRVGFVTEASARGLSLEEIMAVTKHKTPGMVMRYNRAQDQLQSRAVRGVLARGKEPHAR